MSVVKNNVVTLHPRPGLARCASQPAIARESVTLAEVPGFLAAVRKARTLRPDISTRVFADLGRGHHPTYHPTRAEITAEVLIIFADGVLSQGAA